MRLRLVAALAAFVLLAMAVMPAVAADKPQDLIVGKWQPSEAKDKDKAVLEFMKDGKLKVTAEQLTIDGTYKFVDDKTLEVKITFGGEEKATKLIVTVTKDQLTTQEEGKGPDGKEKKKETFNRMK